MKNNIIHINVRENVCYNELKLGEIEMDNINVTNFRKDIYKLLDNVIKNNEQITISTKNGNAVILSEEEYSGLMETLYLYSVPGLVEELVKRKNDEDEEFIDEEEVEW